MQSGIILINKPTGMTSRFVVDMVAKLYQTNRVGHTGTLDPLASGLLIICVNHATKLVNFLMTLEKEYLVTMKLGILTDTLDITGEMLKEDSKKVDDDQIIEVINGYQTTYEQEVPIYSAVKVDGKKCYEYARSNQPVKLPVKTVTIKQISDILINGSEISFKCVVSKGTYIRSLVRDIGESLGTYATMTGLVRTKQGQYTLSDASELDDEHHLIEIEKLFMNYASLILSDEEVVKIKHGIVIDNPDSQDYIRIYDHHQELIAIYQKYEKDTTKLKPLIIFENINNT